MPGGRPKDLSEKYDVDELLTLVPGWALVAPRPDKGGALEIDTTERRPKCHALGHRESDPNGYREGPDDG